MKAKPVIPRETANRVVDGAIADYLRQAGDAVAFGFIDALEQASGRIGTHPPQVLHATPMNSTSRACVPDR